MNALTARLLIEKPEMISNFPEWLLPKETLETLRRTDRLAIAEIAGRDSIAAVLRAIDTTDIGGVLPTIAYTGTEYGNWDIPFEKTDLLSKRLQERGIVTFPPVVLGAPSLWSALCGSNMVRSLKKFGFCTPCIGCHLYLHAIRIPLAKMTECTLVIGGERELHDGRIKLNQVGTALDSYISLLRRFDIELILPLRQINTGSEVESILGFSWPQGGEQLKCVLSGNYIDENGEVPYSNEAVRKYLGEYAIPLMEKTILDVLSENKGIVYKTISRKE